MKDWSKTPLKSKERKAIQAAVKLLKASFPVNRVILYGSKAQGGGDPFSDIDLLLICDTLLNWRVEKEISDMLFDIGMVYDVIFSPLFLSMEEWRGGMFTSFPIYKEIVKHGAVVG